MVSNDRVLLFSDWRYAWGIKNAMSRVVHRVSQGFVQWNLVLLLTTYVKGVSTMLLPVAHIKYRITHMLCPTLYAAVTNELNC